jgi:hypothetical protein
MEVFVVRSPFHLGGITDDVSGEGVVFVDAVAEPCGEDSVFEPEGAVVLTDNCVFSVAGDAAGIAGGCSVLFEGGAGGPLLGVEGAETCGATAFCPVVVMAVVVVGKGLD